MALRLEPADRMGMTAPLIGLQQFEAVDSDIT
jgi:hypothetical protein